MDTWCLRNFKLGQPETRTLSQIKIALSSIARCIHVAFFPTLLATFPRASNLLLEQNNLTREQQNV